MAESLKAIINEQLEQTLLDLCMHIRRITKNASSEEINSLPKLVDAVAGLAMAIGCGNTISQG